MLVRRRMGILWNGRDCLTSNNTMQIITINANLLKIHHRSAVTAGISGHFNSAPAAKAAHALHSHSFLTFLPFFQVQRTRNEYTVLLRE